jgi:tetratricopeptide (TPR) repeat protein
MKTNHRSLLSITLAILFFNAAAQDTTQVNKLLDLGYRYEETNKDSALILYREALKLSTDIHYLTGSIKSYRYVGIVNSDLANYGEAIISYEKSMNLAVKANRRKDEAISLMNIGNVYYHQGNFPKCFDYFFKASNILKEQNDSTLLTTVYNSLGIAYYEVKDFGKSIENYKRGMQLAEQLKDSANLAGIPMNMGNTLLALGKYDSAVICYNEGLKVAKQINDLQRIFISLNGLSSVYRHQLKLDEALDYSLEALDYAQKTEEPEVISDAMLTCGLLYSNLGKHKQALKYLDAGLAIAQQYHIIANLASGYEWRFQVYLKTGEIANAGHDYELSIAYDDSLRNEEKFKEIGQLVGKYELENELREKKIEEERLATAEQLKKDRRNLIQYFSVALLLVVLFITIKLVSNLNVPPKTSHAITFVSLLLLFEFLLVVLDPLIDNWSGSIPVYKLLLNLLLALLITPFHEWLLKFFQREAPGRLSR